MRRSSSAPLICAWFLGLCGAFFRCYEWFDGYVARKNLFSPGPWTWLLCVFSALSVLLLIRISYRPFPSSISDCSGPGGWHRFRTRPKLPREGGLHGRAGMGYLDVNAAAAAALAVVGAAGLWQQSRLSEKNVVALAAYAMCLFAAAAVIAAARQVAWDARSPRFPVLLMFPSACTLLYLIVRYQQFAREPALLIYLWQLLAQVATVLAVYFMVSLSLGKGTAARTGAMSLIAVFLTLVTLGDPFMYSIRRPVALLMSLFALLYLSAQAWLLLREEPDPEQYPLPTKNDPSEEIHDER